jgi:hypothetical protein
MEANHGHHWHGKEACTASGAFLYQRHRPEKTLLYRLVSKHYPVFKTPVQRFNACAASAG